MFLLWFECRSQGSWLPVKCFTGPKSYQFQCFHCPIPLLSVYWLGAPWKEMILGLLSFFQSSPLPPIIKMSQVDQVEMPGLLRCPHFLSTLEMPPFPSHMHLVLKRYLAVAANLQPENSHIQYSANGWRAHAVLWGKSCLVFILGGSRNRYTHSLSWLFNKYLWSQALCRALGRYSEQERCDPFPKEITA